MQKRLPNWFSKNEKSPLDHATHPDSDHSQDPPNLTETILDTKDTDDSRDQAIKSNKPNPTTAEPVIELVGESASTTTQTPEAVKTSKNALAWSNDGLHKLGKLYQTAKESVQETANAYTSSPQPSSTQTSHNENNGGLDLSKDEANASLQQASSTKSSDNKNNEELELGKGEAKNKGKAKKANDEKQHVDPDPIHEPLPEKPVASQVEIEVEMAKKIINQAISDTTNQSRKPSKSVKVAAKVPIHPSFEQEEFNHFAILEAVETQTNKKAAVEPTEKKQPHPHLIKEQTKEPAAPNEVNTESLVNEPTNTSHALNKNNENIALDVETPHSSSNDSNNNHETTSQNKLADHDKDNSEANENPIEAENPHSAKPLNNQNEHLNQARNSLKSILDDKNIPETIRQQLKQDFQQLQGMLHKLEKEQIHIAVFGRVSVGKSSLLNAMIGKKHFSVSLLHGETKNIAMQRWEEYNDGNIYLLDTPGINEIDGEEREEMALNAAHRADLLLFVVDSDLTESEMAALRLVTETQRPSLLVINKADQYTEREQLQLRSIIRERIKGLIAPENIVFTKAREQQETVIYIDQYGEERESLRVKPVDVSQLKSRLWDIMAAEGHTLAALNASLFASDMSSEVAQRILVIRQVVGRKLINYYCIGKGVAVAANPIPVADLVAAAAIDAGMIAHLSRIYGLPITKHEAGELIQTISAQLIVLLGTTWAINLASSALKITTVGLSTIVTAATQGAIAWYSTLVIGRVAETWLVNGKSWGDTGPKLVVQSILDDLDRDSVMKEAKQEIMLYLKR